MSLIVINDDCVAKYVLEHLPDEGIESIDQLRPFVALGVYDTVERKALCGVVYNWYRPMQNGADMRVVIAADDPRWCQRRILRELFRYPFEEAGCERLTAVIKDGNQRSLKLCLGLGFKREGILRRGWNGRTNAIVLGMLKSECKWLNYGRVANVKKVSSDARGARSGKNNSGADGRQPLGCG